MGAHFSIARGLDRAVRTAAAHGCTALQIFTKNASTWKERTLLPEEIDAFKAAQRATGITHVAAHAAYLLNLASPEPGKHRMSLDALRQELERSSALGIAHVVLHPGNHMGAGEGEGIQKIIAAINGVFDACRAPGTRLLLETTAGQGSSLGGRFEHLRSILDGIFDPDRVAVCLDTSHIFAAGYDIRTREAYEKTLAAFDDIIGLDRLELIHLNDSKRKLGSRVDRHEHVGEGYIGMDAFRFIMQEPRFEAIPKIIETPKFKGALEYDRVNLDRLRALVNP